MMFEKFMYVDIEPNIHSWMPWLPRNEKAEQETQTEEDDKVVRLHLLSRIQDVS